jgi:hypothetical protein
MTGADSTTGGADEGRGPYVIVVTANCTKLQHRYNETLRGALALNRVIELLLESRTDAPES